MQICRIRLSDKTSCLYPRRPASKLCQPYEPEMPVKVREWIAPALGRLTLCLHISDDLARSNNISRATISRPQVNPLDHSIATLRYVISRRFWVFSFAAAVEYNHIIERPVDSPGAPHAHDDRHQSSHHRRC
jgi:hypothetical protein